MADAGVVRATRRRLVAGVTAAIAVAVAVVVAGAVGYRWRNGLRLFDPASPSTAGGPVTIGETYYADVNFAVVGHAATVELRSVRPDVVTNTALAGYRVLTCHHGQDNVVGAVSTPRFCADRPAPLHAGRYVLGDAPARSPWSSGSPHGTGASSSSTGWMSTTSSAGGTGRSASESTSSTAARSDRARHREPPSAIMRTPHEDARTADDPGVTSADTWPGPGQRFAVRPKHLFGPFYSVRVFDTKRNTEVLVTGGAFLTGRSSALRAARSSAARYLGEVEGVRAEPGRHQGG